MSGDVRAEEPRGCERPGVSLSALEHQRATLEAELADLQRQIAGAEGDLACLRAAIDAMRRRYPTAQLRRAEMP
jgi:septal ring factor EnvC (AmiA/AmiB activator)